VLKNLFTPLGPGLVLDEVLDDLPDGGVVGGDGRYIGTLVSSSVTGGTLLTTVADLGVDVLLTCESSSAVCGCSG